MEDKERIVGKEGGIKNDGFGTDNPKLRYELLPFDVIDDVVDILTFGASKYGSFNWCNVEPDRYKGALLRHISEYMQGSRVDDDSGKPVIAHIITNAIFLAWIDKNKVESNTVTYGCSSCLKAYDKEEYAEKCCEMCGEEHFEDGDLCYEYQINEAEFNGDDTDYI